MISFRRLGFLFLAFVLTACTSTKAPEPVSDPIAPIDWLKANQSPVSLAPTDTASGLNLMEPDLDRYQAFLTGEVHGVAENYQITYMFQTYLNQRANVVYNLAELPWSVGQEINRYLKTGDEAPLLKVHQDAIGTTAGTEQSLAYWRQVYAYNQTLPEAKRIEVIGIDGELEATTPFYHLQQLLPAKPAPAVIAPLLAKIEPLTTRQDPYDFAYSPAATELQRSLAAALQEHEAAFKAYLGANYGDFAFTVQNIGEGIRLRYLMKMDNPRFNSERELLFFRTLETLAPQLTRGNFYGQWGLYHTIQKEFQTEGYADVKPKLAQWLNESYPLTKGKVLSIPIQYIGSSGMTYGPDGGTSMVHQTLTNSSDLTYASLRTVTLFKLTGDSSPFAKELHLWADGTGGVTTDYFQYVLMLRDGQPTTMIR